MKPVPLPITVNTGEQASVQETIDDFFVDTKRVVEEKIRTRPFDFKIESGELAYSPNTVTNDRVTYLKYKDEIIAAVFATRTELNYVHYNFFRNISLSEK